MFQNSVNRIVDFCVTYKVTVRQVVSYLEKAVRKA